MVGLDLASLLDDDLGNDSKRSRSMIQEKSSRPGCGGAARRTPISGKSCDAASPQAMCHCQPTPAEAREFRKRWSLLTEHERELSLHGDVTQFLNTVRELLPCMGCRNDTEDLFYRLLDGSNRTPALVQDAGLFFTNRPEDRQEREKQRQYHPRIEQSSSAKKGKKGTSTSVTKPEYFPDPVSLQFKLVSRYRQDPEALQSLFLHQERWGSAWLNKLGRNGKPSASNRARCSLHSQRARGKPRPAAFEALWHRLPEEQKRHLSHVDSDQFLTDLENYLRRHRFCCRCKEKVLEAYDLLIGTSCSEDDCEDCAGLDFGDKSHDHSHPGHDLDDAEDEEDEDELLGPEDYGDELHYTSYLFDEVTYSRATGHLVVPCRLEYMAQLMTRASQEVVGDWGDRHARTIAEAQDEVLICLGMVIWDKLQALWNSWRSAKRGEELLVHCAVTAIRRNFDLAVEALHGQEMMAQLLAEEDEESSRLARKKEKKKEKKKKRKGKKAGKAPSEECKEEPKQAANDLTSQSTCTSSVDGDQETVLLSDSNEVERKDSPKRQAPFGLDESRERSLLWAMGWDMVSVSSDLDLDVDTDDDHHGIPDAEIAEWQRKRSDLVQKRRVKRQQLQERFDQLVRRSAPLSTQ